MAASTAKYTPVTNSHHEEEICCSDEHHQIIKSHERALKKKSLVWIVWQTLFVILLVVFFQVRWQELFQKAANLDRACADPVIRREWRTLRRSEQLSYLDAVSCLRKLPSSRNVEQSLYDDFPYTHSLVGNYSHNTEDFLIWHRLFLHVYESTLRDRCGYNGHLTYWDWSLDAEDLTKSPVFDNVYGFGGNGNSSAPKSVAYGHCVTEGPFANLKAYYFGPVAEVKRHCLSRGFISPEAAREKKRFVGPDALEKVLDSPDYDTFYSRLELGPHNTIPKTIRGDFYRVTAPYDPVFFLHHTQLDRLWHKWQLVDPETRITKISGKLGANTSEDEMLSRTLDMGILSGSTPAAQMLDTRRGPLCYTY